MQRVSPLQWIVVGVFVGAGFVIGKIIAVSLMYLLGLVLICAVLGLVAGFVWFKLGGVRRR